MKTKYAVDTNIIVRLLKRDDDRQVQSLIQLITGKNVELFIASIVLIEAYWVLKSAYKMDKLNIVNALILLVESEEIILEEKEVMINTLYGFRDTNVDLVDVYLAEKARLHNIPVLTWNAKDFRKLNGEFYSPEQLI